MCDTAGTKPQPSGEELPLMHSTSTPTGSCTTSRVPTHPVSTDSSVLLQHVGMDQDRAQGSCLETTGICVGDSAPQRKQSFILSLV